MSDHPQSQDWIERAGRGSRAEAIDHLLENFMTQVQDILESMQAAGFNIDRAYRRLDALHARMGEMLEDNESLRKEADLRLTNAAKVCSAIHEVVRDQMQYADHNALLHTIREFLPLAGKMQKQARALDLEYADFTVLELEIEAKLFGTGEVMPEEKHDRRTRKPKDQFALHEAVGHALEAAELFIVAPDHKKGAKLKDKVNNQLDIVRKALEDFNPDGDESAREDNITRLIKAVAAINKFTKWVGKGELQPDTERENERRALKSDALTLFRKASEVARGSSLDGEEAHR